MLVTSPCLQLERARPEDALPRVMPGKKIHAAMITIDRERLDRMLGVFAEATLGNYDVRIPALEESPDDSFLELEVAANMLLDELLAERARTRRQQQEIQEQAELLRVQQAELVRALSTPIVVVAPGVLALPIIGTVQADRAQNMTEAMLARVVAERATHVILDLTGAGDIAAGTAASLLRMAQSVRLLGSRCILTGLSPEMAKTLVKLDFDSSQVVTLPQLADALAMVLTEKKTPKRASVKSEE